MSKKRDVQSVLSMGGGLGGGLGSNLLVLLGGGRLLFGGSSSDLLLLLMVSHVAPAVRNPLDALRLALHLQNTLVKNNKIFLSSFFALFSRTLMVVKRPVRRRGLAKTVAFSLACVTPPLAQR
jgi:hypothetical protein